MTYERLLVRLQRRERRALEDLYDATASRLYACLYHDLPDEQQCEYVLGLLYETWPVCSWPLLVVLWPPPCDSSFATWKRESEIGLRPRARG